MSPQGLEIVVTLYSPEYIICTYIQTVVFRIHVPTKSRMMYINVHIPVQKCTLEYYCRKEVYVHILKLVRYFSSPRVSRAVRQ